MSQRILPIFPVQREVAPPDLLRVQGLTTRFFTEDGVVHAVENVSFTLAPGETLSLVGESGCGKSTVGRGIVRLLKPRTGIVRLEGEDVARLDPTGLRAMRRRMQIIFQDPFASLDPRQTVGSAIAEPLTVHGIVTPRHLRDRVASLLDDVELSPDMVDRYPHEFSGGQRQRICLARALALEPKLIIADESVSALDATTKLQILNLLGRLQERFGLSYLFISHDMAVVERISHRVAVMHSGEIVEIGPAATVMQQPAHAYTRRLLDAVPVPDPGLRRHRAPGLGEEVSDPLRSLDYVAPARQWREVGPEHFVMT